MRIIHCAPFNIVTKIGGTLYANPVKISQGLLENNHFVHNFDYRDTARYYSFFKNKKGGVNKMNQLFLECVEAINPELIIFGHAELIAEETFYTLKRKNIKLILWYNDMIIEEHLKKVGHLFDMVLITGAGQILQEVKTFNPNAFFLPNPVNHNVERHQGFTKLQTHDLLFSGRKDNERTKFIQLIQENLRTLDIKFIGQTHDQTVIGEPYFQLIADSKVCLNHSRDAYRYNKWYTSDRLMHILGNGSFCLSRTIIDGEDFFEDKLVYYDDFEDMRLKTLYYLENTQERIQKTQWLHKRVHTLFNTKSISGYIIHLLEQNHKELCQYLWWEK